MSNNWVQLWQFVRWQTHVRRILSVSLGDGISSLVRSHDSKPDQWWNKRRRWRERE